MRLANGAIAQGEDRWCSPPAPAGARSTCPGEREYRNRGVAYCPHCDGPLFKGKRVAVIGGGNSGVEAAIDLAGLVSHVTLIEFDRAAARRRGADAQAARASPTSPSITSAQTTEVHRRRPEGQRLWSTRIGATASRIRVELDGVFVQIGLVPNTDWLKGTVKLSPRGEIDVDARGATSVPGVFAAGDCTTVPFKQIVIADGRGREGIARARSIT